MISSVFACLPALPSMHAESGLPCTAPCRLVPKPQEKLYGDNQGNDPGWAELFMRYLNDSWPHPDHIFINAGKWSLDRRRAVLLLSSAGMSNFFFSIPPASSQAALLIQLQCLCAGKAASSPAIFVNGQCFEAALPPRADVVILETMAQTDALSLERLIWRVLRHFSAQPVRPAIIVYNSVNVAVRPWGEHCSPSDGNHTSCCQNFKSLMQSSWAVVDPAPAWNTKQYDHNLGAGSHHELARYYGVASLSHRDFLWKYLTTQAWRAMSLRNGECELLNMVNADTIHPTTLGQVLLADYFFAYVGGAFEADARRRADSGEGSRVSADVAAFIQGAGHTTLPSKPYHAGGRAVYQLRCYGHSNNGTRWKKKRSALGIADLQIVKGHGFQFFMNTTNGSAGKRKPGWVATEPGSYMEVSVSTVFRSGGEEVPNAEVVLVLLASYEHMGRATVVCMSGCECQAAEIDAHHTDRWSTEQLHVLGVTPAQRCVLRVQVRNETSSGEHKFKVLQVVARAMVQE